LIGVDIGDEAIRTIQDRFQNGSRPMGDYVKKKAKPQKAQMTMALFGDKDFEDEPYESEMECNSGDTCLSYDMFEER